ncbi:PTS IIA-like nitrogen regulatory protein PtsN [Pasteurella multocida]|uniref:PTS IIA-like nitrogen regulatory protein PtsN n=1 Tax=Pasteurella multocida TaxID=747 RepID=UPI002A51E16B|nr:PTS IIA-like nitrogen regulatory protein PtsN [Pasteurella multocida]MDY0487991.1 PTS IIA-like nitrogen regulatory protein PtsN [Pasteurella multocida]MDY0594570.1 PTS IIA-like nitrogen regulatory protein PtsN [Pasteurella multocida]MDY0663980.1 PTS IIA-like nitrogen regulatory protein PtsN [Pasteurella multocida]MDY0666078.1 PTS IIA-like nitrogen regulatory protein PtsN [Pasteurella multocida]
MIKFTELLKPENIRQGLICSSKKRLFEIITQVIADQIQLENAEQLCFECLLSREKIGNSGLGNGIAMPKARIPEGNQPLAVFIHLDSPVDYESADHRDVDLILAILVPEQLCERYISALPEIAEKFSDKTLCKQLRNAQNVDEIWQIFENVDQLNTQENVTKASAETTKETE